MLSNKVLKIAITGHRYWKNPEKERKLLWRSFKILTAYLDYNGFRNIELLHGCAEGVDLWFGEYALREQYKYRLYLPFPLDVQLDKSGMSHSSKNSLIRQRISATDTVVVNPTFSTYGYQKRNMVLVQNCNILCTYYTRKRSGSHNCVMYAKKVGIPIINLYEGGRNEFKTFFTNKYAESS
jgi:hypothetical protein